MDEATVDLIIELAAVATPFLASGIVWLEKKISKVKDDKQISDEQGDLIVETAKVLYDFAKAKCAGDATKTAALGEGEKILELMEKTWGDEKGTTEFLEAQLANLKTVLAKL